MHIFKRAIGLRFFCRAAGVPARVQKAHELRSTGRIWKCHSSKCTGQERGGAQGSCGSQQLQQGLWEGAAEMLLSPPTATSRRMVMQCYLLMHASVWDMWKSLNYFEARIWYSFRCSATNRLLPLMLLNIFPKLLEILVAVVNQIPQQILVHKTQLGWENSLYLFVLHFPVELWSPAYVKKSDIFQEILVIVWMIKANPVTVQWHRHWAIILIMSHNTKSKHYTILVVLGAFVVFFFIWLLSSNFSWPKNKK